MLNKLPVIGITSRQRARGPEDGITVLGNKINFSVVGHSWAIEKSGGIPLVFPLLQGKGWEQFYIDMVDGIVISEGEDIEPSKYGEERLPECSEDSNEVKDSFEIKIAKLALEKNIPILGICGGMHILNVSLGGTLYQDINKYFITKNAKKIIHREEGDLMYKLYHPVTLKKDSLIANCYEELRLEVNSIHHQCVKKLGKELSITAQSDDGLVEAIEMTKNNFALGVQWHPERIWKDHKFHLKLFKKFISEASNYKYRKE